jgi:hypothetical protein
MVPREVAGWLRVVGAIAFLGAANLSLVRIWTAPQDRQLREITSKPRFWEGDEPLFFGATVMTAAGVWAVPGLVGSAGEPLARAAAVALPIAMVGGTACASSRQLEPRSTSRTR